ncbi:MAG: methionyl-tRNA formyltransferase, partial [Paramuribaculum sp.]|nr:methionyl-tRNA formyltransferase [Paramuribaculum sp.]
PYPAAWTSMEADNTPAGTMKIYSTRLTDTPATEPGRVRFDSKGSMPVDCGDFALEILSLQPQGKKRMPAADYLRGCRFETIRFS